MFKLRSYKKELDYSYALGTFSVLEILKHAPNLVDQVVILDAPKKKSKEQEIITLCEKNNIPFSINKHKIFALAPKANTYAIAVFKKYYKDLETNKNHIVLFSPSNLGNLGMILRTMLVFGFFDLAIIRPGADIFDPKVIASSVGGIFQIRVQYFNSLKEYSLVYPRNYFTFVLKNGKDIRDINFSSASSKGLNFSLIFGNEARGLSLSDSLLGEQVTIPQKSDFDSLNLANAVTISIWEATRRSR